MAGQSKRGFAAMGPQQQREIARRGGQAAHQKGTAHEFTPEEARIAGQRGGKAISRDRQHMAMIGRKGGQSAGRQTTKSGRHTQLDNGGHGRNGGSMQEKNRNVGHDATTMLREDHKKVEELFSQYETADGQESQKKAAIKQICQELTVHAQIEEGIFYPAVQRALSEDGRELVTEAVREHQIIKDLVAQLRGMPSADDSCDDVARQLKERVEHHVQEEEQEMLPQAEAHLQDQLESLGARMRQRKQELMNAAPAAESQQMLGQEHSPQ